MVREPIDMGLHSNRGFPSCSRSLAAPSRITIFLLGPGCPIDQRLSQIVYEYGRTWSTAPPRRVVALLICCPRGTARRLMRSSKRILTRVARPDCGRRCCKHGFFLMKNSPLALCPSRRACLLPQLRFGAGGAALHSTSRGDLSPGPWSLVPGLWSL